MSNLIQIDHDAMKAIASQFGRQSDDVTRMYRQVVTAIEKLRDGGWIGEGADAFFEEMDGEVLPAVQRLIAALAMADKVSNDISQLMENADEEASDPLKREAEAGKPGGVFDGMGGSSGGGPGGGFGGGGPGGGFGGGGPGGGFGHGLPGGIGGFDPGSFGIVQPIGTFPGGESNPWGGNGFTPGGFGDSLLKDIFGSRGFGSGSDSGGMFSPGSSLFGPGGLYGSDFGNTLGPGVYTGDPFGGGYGNDYSVPTDWLSGVGDALFSSYPTGMNDYGIPFDWLSGVTDPDSLFGNPDLDPEVADDTGSEKEESGSSGGGSSGGGEQSGGGSGGGEQPQQGSGSGGGGAPPEEPLEEEELEDELEEEPRRESPGSGGGGGGGQMPETQVSSPYSGSYNAGQSYYGGGFEGEAGEAGESSSGRQYHSAGGGAAPQAEPQAVQRRPVASLDATYSGGTTDDSGMVAAIPMGLAAASPLMALMGKFARDKVKNDG